MTLLTWFCLFESRPTKEYAMKVVVKKKDNAIPVVIGTEFIKLDAALKYANAVESGGMAKTVI